MNITKVKLSELKPDAKNARIHDERNIAAIMQSLQENEQYRPFVVQRGTNRICVGNGMYEAMKRLGIKEAWAEYRDLDDKQFTKLSILDNRTSELAGWDDETLKELFADLGDDALSTGWTQDEIDEVFDGANAMSGGGQIEEDEAPEPEKEAVSKLGDVWLCGSHRVMCGDSTNKAAVDVLMDGQRAELLLTDPPYGINIVHGSNVGGGGKTHFGKVDGGGYVAASTYANIIGDETTETARKSCAIAIGCSNNQIIFGGNYFTDFLPPKPCWIVWDKQNTGNFADCELAWTSFDKSAKLYHWLWNGMSRKGDRDVEGVKRVHPTQKPVGLMSDILMDFSDEDDLILDLFGGSGSTLIACEQTGRKCYMMELAPNYVDVIVKRWEKLTGKQAVRESDGVKFDDLATE